MNIRKPTDYTAMFAALDAAVAAQLPQMELYREIGRVVSRRSEKGAAVAASEYLQAAYPAAEGFSPRNLRRMRGFYRIYGDTLELLVEAMRLNWTQNVVIMEAELTMDEQRWYIRKTVKSSLSKTELLRMIQSGAHLEIPLDETAPDWYTEENNEISEREQYEEDPVYLLWQYLPKPDGGVCDEGLGQEGRVGITIPYRIGSDQPGRDRQSGLSTGAAQAGGAWHLLQRSCRTAAHQSGLRRIRPADWHGQRQPAGHVPRLRRGLCREDVPPNGPYRPSRRCCRPMVHGRFRGNVEGCAGGVSGIT